MLISPSLIISLSYDASLRYIDQCQDLLDAPATLGERKDLELYVQAVQTAKGEGLDYWEEEIPREFVAYVGRGPNHYQNEKDAFQPPYNYEWWLGSVASG